MLDPKSNMAEQLANALLHHQKNLKEQKKAQKNTEMLEQMLEQLEELAEQKKSDS